MKTVLNFMVLVGLLGSTAFAGGKVNWPDCYCTDKAGARVDLGQIICLHVGGRSFMARCEMSLNNPMWRETGKDCISSRNNILPQSLDPLLDTGAVDAKV